MLKTFVIDRRDVKTACLMAKTYMAACCIKTTYGTYSACAFHNFACSAALAVCCDVTMLLFESDYI